MNIRKAKKGKWLTQSTLDDEAGRIFVRSVAGFGDLDALYRDATAEEKAEWEAAHPEEVEE